MISSLKRSKRRSQSASSHAHVIPPPNPRWPSGVLGSCGLYDHRLPSSARMSPGRSGSPLICALIASRPTPQFACERVIHDRESTASRTANDDITPGSGRSRPADTVQYSTAVKDVGGAGFLIKAPEFPLSSPNLRVIGCSDPRTLVGGVAFATLPRSRVLSMILLRLVALRRACISVGKGQMRKIFKSLFFWR